MTSWYFNPILERHLGSTAMAVVVVLAGLLVVAWLIGALASRTTRRRRVMLAGLRLVALLLLLVCMLRPTLVYTVIKERAATVVLLFDQSRSMGISDTFGGKTRYEEMLGALEDAREALIDLGKEFELKAYVFDADATEIEINDGVFQLADVPTGDQSAIGTSVKSVHRREGRKRIAAVIFVSDGSQQTFGTNVDLPRRSVRDLAQLGFPLYTVPLGKSRGARQAREVVVESMPDNRRVFVNNELPIGGTIRAVGFDNRKIRVQLLVETGPGKQETIATMHVIPAAGKITLPYEMSYVPDQPGEYKLTVRAESPERDLSSELSTYVTALEGGLRVLYIEGELRLEQKYLRGSLSRSPDIDVDLRWVDKRKRASGKGWTDFSEEFASDDYDVILLGDVDSDAFRPEDLRTLVDAVTRRGVGLMMLGGWHSFRPGGYHNTALRDVLPVKMDPQIDRFVRQRYGDRVRRDLHLKGPLPMLPTSSLGNRHYTMRLSPPEQNRAAWAKLPPLAGANKFRGVKRGAVVLAESPQGAPLLVAAEAKGRVLAFAGDTTWQWVTQGHADAHRRFWRQTILWLARKDELDKGDVWTTLDGRRFLPGGRLRFDAGARSPEGDPLSDAKLTATIIDPDGERLNVRLSRLGTDMTGTFADTQKPGDYTLEVTAEHEGKSVGRARARFIVLDQDLELLNSAADPSLMASLAEMTAEAGGRRIAPEELSDLLREIQAKPKDFEEEVQQRVTHWDQWYFFLMLVGVLSGEWFLRKRWRLV